MSPLGSIQSFDPGPAEATYGATKATVASSTPLSRRPRDSRGSVRLPQAFLLSISRAMHYELRSTGISVTAACPGFTPRCHPETTL